MNAALFLPWFPIVLAVGVGGRLLGRARGFGLGILCALFWVCLAVGVARATSSEQALPILSILAGALAIVAMGGWAGESGVVEDAAPSPASLRREVPDRVVPLHVEPDTLERFAAAIEAFNDWLGENGHQDDPWPLFDQFLRSTLHDCCSARRIRPYRVAADGEQLVPLREHDPLVPPNKVPARIGLVGHVTTTGRSYVADDAADSELLRILALEDESPAWCFPIQDGSRSIGVVVVGQLDRPPERMRSLLRLCERIVGQFWRTLEETVRRRSAAVTDHTSAVQTREAFLDTAGRALADSYAQGEPVALAVLAVEGLRELNDAGRWEDADEVVREVGAVLQRKVRADDRVGRFDGSRFLILLRRVDSELAALIAGQLLGRLTVLCADEERWGRALSVRCGLSGSGMTQPDLRALLKAALAQCREARVRQVPIMSDLGEPNWSAVGERSK